LSWEKARVRDRVTLFPLGGGEAAAAAAEEAMVGEEFEGVFMG